MVQFWELVEDPLDVDKRQGKKLKEKAPLKTDVDNLEQKRNSVLKYESQMLEGFES